MQAKTVVAVAGTALALLGGCGSTDDEDTAQREEAAARKTVVSLYAAMRAKDAEAVCRVLTPEVQRALLGRQQLAGGCPAGLDEMFASGDLRTEGANVAVRRVSVEGFDALAAVSVDGTEIELALVRSGGRWLVASLGAP